VAALADTFAVSDRTFEWSTVPSFEAHIDLVTGTSDGFYDNPPRLTHTGAINWGCSSGITVDWSPSGLALFQLEPTCVPGPKTSPEYALEPTAVQNSPVAWVPTIMDQFDATGVSWRIYAAAAGHEGYNWSTCPSFADCHYTGQQTNVVGTSQILSDAQSGKLPNLSILLPYKGATGFGDVQPSGCCSPYPSLMIV
jgi:hypothetical protein